MTEFKPHFDHFDLDHRDRSKYAIFVKKCSEYIFLGKKFCYLTEKI